MGVTWKDCNRQSQTVWDQFGKKWVSTAKKNAELDRKDVEELRHVGIGRTLVSVAMGASVESQIETLKEYRGKCDIITCDKGFKMLHDKGIKVDYVHLADTNIETRWMGGDDSPLWKETKGVKLICTPYANYEWTKRWKGPRYFYVNKDAIRSEKTFLKIIPGARIVPASTNVSNAMVVFMTGSDELIELNYAGYDRILLIGYDYSWEVGSNYYAFNNPKPKRFYMAHRSLLDVNAKVCRSSENLIFSAKWLSSYLTQSKSLNVVNCSDRGILQIPLNGKLKEILSKIKNDPEKVAKVNKAFQDVMLHADNVKKAKVTFKEAKEAIYGCR